MKKDEAIRIAKNVAVELNTFFQNISYDVYCGAHWKEIPKETPASLAKTAINLVPTNIQKMKGHPIIQSKFTLNTTAPRFVKPLITIKTINEELKEIFGDGAEIVNEFVDLQSQTFQIALKYNNYYFHFNFTV